MNKQIGLLLLASLMILTGCNKNKTGSGEDAALEKRVDSVMSNLTLEEKVGQMAQYTLDVIGKEVSPNQSVDPFEFDPAKLDTILGMYKVGSILNTTNNKAQTTEMWSYIIKTIQDRAIRETGIPVLFGIDAIHGTNYTAGATLFPQGVGMGAPFNPALMEVPISLSTTTI